MKFIPPFLYREVLQIYSKLTMSPFYFVLFNESFTHSIQNFNNLYVRKYQISNSTLL